MSGEKTDLDPVPYPIAEVLRCYIYLLELEPLGTSTLMCPAQC